MKSLIFAYLLVNVLRLSNIILTCSRYILDFLLLCSAGSKNVKNNDRDDYILAVNIENTCPKNTCIGNTYTVNT